MKSKSAVPAIMLSPRVAGESPPPVASWGLNSSGLSGGGPSTHAPLQVPLGLPKDSGLDRGSGAYIKKEEMYQRSETPDVERSEGEKRRSEKTVAEAVAHAEALLHAKMQEVEGQFESEKEQLVAQAAEQVCMCV